MRRVLNSDKSGKWMLRLVGLAGFLALLSGPAMAGANFILEVKGSSLQPVLNTYGLTLQRQLFSSSQLTVGVVSAPDGAPSSLASTVAQDASVVKFQQDRLLGAKAPAIPTLNQGMSNTQAWLLSQQNAQQKTKSYLTQPALGIIGSSAGNKGAGVTVAVIDTAVDPNHSVLAGKLLTAVDCVGSTATSSCAGPVSSIWKDPKVTAALDQSTVIILDQSTVIILDQSTVIILDQSTVIILDQSTVIILDSNGANALQGKQLPADFGHGTMVASLISAAAPKASILPIRAFQADGSAQLSDIVAAVYYAVNHGAKVINMSFDIDTSDPALADAIAAATAQGVICVASTGNVSSNATVYPAAYNSATQSVIGVGSVDSQMGLFRSSFSGYGAPSVDVYAPGENLIAAYPGNHFAVASGTSFSTALASGVAAVVESSKISELNNYVDALTNSGSPILFPFDGTKVVNAKSALKSIR
jgi:subtilisin family serine protease